MFATTLTMTALLAFGLPLQDTNQGADSHAGHSHDGSDPFGVFLDHTSPAICTVSFILEIRGGQMDREVPMTTAGTIISNDGLVMMSSSALEMANRMQWSRRGRGGRGGGEADLQIEATPLDMRIMLGGQFDEYEAELVAKDSTLGLAFLQVKEPEALSKITPVSFDTTRKLRVGEELLGINRLGEDHDHAAVMGWTRLAGKLDQPRTMWAVSPGFNSRGLPLFNRFGEAVGILSAQSGTAGSEDSGDRGMGRGGMGGGGGGAQRVFLVEAADVKAVIDQARSKAAEDREGDPQHATATENE